MNFISAPLFFKAAGVFGCCLIVAGALIAGISYRGKRGESYSPLNHFISELGEVGVSKRAWAFNWGLIICGVLLLPATIYLGLALPGIWAKIGMFFGVVTAVSLSFVGVFSMDRIKPHGLAAITFFRGGLLMVLFFTIAVAFQPTDAPKFSKALAYAGIPAICAFTSFLLMLSLAHKPAAKSLDPTEKPRPRVWALAIVEWAIFVTIVFWFLMAAATV